MLLTHYSALAKDQQITFRIRINIPDQFSIQESDLSVLLGNLLENAMLAAGNADKPHRFIHLNMTDVYKRQLLRFRLPDCMLHDCFQEGYMR